MGTCSFCFMDVRDVRTMHPHLVTIDAPWDGTDVAYKYLAKTKSATQRQLKYKLGETVLRYGVRL